MDSITHIALGAVVGEALAGKSLGKRALFLGAIGQSLPDIDFVASFWLSPTADLLAHRGFTHSFTFGALATVILAVAAQRWHRARGIPIATWMVFWGVEILIHLLLDASNAYGIGWLEPFAHTRFSYHILFVADPFFSAPVGIALIALTTLDSKKTRARRVLIAAGLILSSAYFMYAVFNKKSVDNDIRAALDAQQLNVDDFISTPTPLNSWLWYIVAKSDSGFYTGYRSVFDGDPDIRFRYFPQRNDLLANLEREKEVRQLKRFSDEYYTVEHYGDTLVFNVLRFGQIAGWNDQSGKFVFHYYLNNPDANLLVIQRGRFSNWNRRTAQGMIRRIRGN